MAGNYQRPWLPENRSRSSSSIVFPALCLAEGGEWDAISHQRSERKTETFKTFTGIKHTPASEIKSFSQPDKDSKGDSLDNEFDAF